ncbi:uncharacterized protein LOC133832874 [Humulus lupulus]|uniref:uncharacterized protein LOC133832874 n=1 Tax=Humulus lupulus TaxID=3486 RepID=UPI002B41596A|nr:uncharacterized protein LOC133832874 [Humulus lupulus]
MAKGARNVGKAKAKGKVKKSGPSSSDGIIKTRLMDAIRGFKSWKLSRIRERFLNNWDVDLGKNPSSLILRSLNSEKMLTSSCGDQSTGLETPLTQEKKFEIKIESEEINNWQSSIVCYLVGSNPPVSVLDGFVRRLWKDNVDKVGLLSHGFLVVVICSLGKKPLVMKPWNSVDDFSKEDITSVPTWIQLGCLDIKYWGEHSLFKIVGQIGKPIQGYNITKLRDRLCYPRILIEVSLDQNFPTRIRFMNEFDQEIELQVEYEWVPIVCQHCFGFGHETQLCRKKQQVKQELVPKKSVAEQVSVLSTVDEVGFQKVIKGTKRQESMAIPTSVTNQYSMLVEENVTEEIQRLNTGGGGGGDPFICNG